MAHTNFIPGLHYFCDHRCWRCGLASRCAVHAKWAASAASSARVGSPAARVESVVALSLSVTLEEVSTVMKAAGVSSAPCAPEAEAQVEAAIAAARAEVEREGLVARGREYAQQSWAVLQVVRPILASRRDHDGLEAAERLEEMCLTVASKIFRVASSARDPEFDAAEIQSDSNGSAKVALLLIEESRHDWRVLMAAGRGVADGAPARFLAMLDDLERGLLARFPRAFEFVRPGFDTGDLAGDHAGVAKALREPAVTRVN